jgi:prevent-host-death family protein
MRRFWRRWSGQTGQSSLTRATPKGRLAQYNTYDARTFFSDLLRRVRTGEEIVIAHAGHPVAKLVPLTEPAATRPGVVRMTVFVNDGTIATEATPADGGRAAAPEWLWREGGPPPPSRREAER